MLTKSRNLFYNVTKYHSTADWINSTALTSASPSQQQHSIVITSASHSTKQSTEDCLDWRDAQHIIFQIANLCLLIGFLIPITFRYHSVCLRGLLALGSLFLVIWGGCQICQLDVLAWYLVYLLVHLCHTAYAVYTHWPVFLVPEMREVYSKVFEPVNVTRSQFKELVGEAVIKDLPNGATYSLEGATKLGEKLSIVLSGRLRVTCEGIFLHHVESNQFVDSPEFEAVSENESCQHYQVSIKATEDSRLLTWSYNALHTHLNTSIICTVFKTLLGKDITHKLYQVQEMLLANPHYVEILSSRGSAVNLRHRMSVSYGADRPNLNGILNMLSSASAHSSSSASPPPRVPTPDGPYSPSQLSFETCV